MPNTVKCNVFNSNWGSFVKTALKVFSNDSVYKDLAFAACGLFKLHFPLGKSNDPQLREKAYRNSENVMLFGIEFWHFSQIASKSLRKRQCLCCFPITSFDVSKCCFPIGKVPFADDVNSHQVWLTNLMLLGVFFVIFANIELENLRKQNVDLENLRAMAGTKYWVR